MQEACQETEGFSQGIQEVLQGLHQEYTKHKKDSQAHIKQEPQEESQAHIKEEPQKEIQAHIKEEPQEEIQAHIKEEPQEEIQAHIKEEPQEESQAHIKEEPLEEEDGKIIDTSFCEEGCQKVWLRAFQPHSKMHPQTHTQDLQKMRKLHCQEAW